MINSNIIYGKDSTECIVNISIKNDTAHIFQRNGNEIREIVKPYSPWLLGSKMAENVIRLKGKQHFQYLKYFKQDRYNEILKNKPYHVYAPRSIQEGFMTIQGYTYFKGMKTSDVSLLSFDIETLTLDKNHVDAQVVLISNTYRDASGAVSKRLFQSRSKDTEIQMIKDWCAWVREINPDVLLGHNIYSFDLPYLNSRCPLVLGRDNSEIQISEDISQIRKDANQKYDFNNIHIFGREIIDTFFLSIKYDIGRNFPSYGLKQIEKHLGLRDENRTDWDFKTNPVEKTLTDENLWNKFCDYCRDDANSPIKMFDIMIPSFFYFNQSVPKTFQQMGIEATGSQLDSMMIRAYLQEGFSQPRFSEREPFEGAISMGVPGLYKNVRKIDVASLYPSIMLEYNIYNKEKDPKRYMLQILEYFRDERLKNKKLAAQTKEQYFDDLQNSQKIAINSMYGFLGAGYLLYNYPEGAADVTKRGREILCKAVEWATGHTLQKTVKKIVNQGSEDEEIRYEWTIGEKVSKGKGYVLVNADTDSISYTDGNVCSSDDFKKEIEEINSLYPKMISWADDGIFSVFCVIRAKNYIMVKDGKTKVKGASLTDQKKEYALQMFIKKIIEIITTKGLEYNELIDLYDKTCFSAKNIININEWCVKKTVTKSILTSTRSNELKVYNSLKEALNKKLIGRIQEGDKIFVYQAIEGLKHKLDKGAPVYSKKGEPKMVINTILRFPELWNKDQDTWHYVERIYETLKIFNTVIDLNKFTKYHLKKNQELLNEKTI